MNRLHMNSIVINNRASAPASQTRTATSPGLASVDTGPATAIEITTPRQEQFRPLPLNLSL